MGILINKETGNAEQLSNEAGEVALQQGTHAYPLVDQNGEAVMAEPTDYQRMLQEGHVQPNEQQLNDMMMYAERSTPAEMAKTAALGLASGIVSSPIANLASKALGSTDQDIMERREVNPITYGASEAAGLIGSAIKGKGQGALLTKIGTGAKELAGLEAGAKLWGSANAAKIAGAAVAGGAEQAIFQALDETGKMIANDPNQSAASALANVGLGGLLGLGAGGALGSVPVAWSSLMESKAGKFVQDFKGRLQQHAVMGNPAESMTKELTEHYSTLSRNLARESAEAGSKEFNELMPAMKEFERRFTTKIEGVPTVDPGKIDKYINSLGKPGNKIKEDILSNFINAADKYNDSAQKGSISFYERNNFPWMQKAEMESLPNTSISKSTLKEITPGGKLADELVRHGMYEGLGISIGAGIGRLTGAGSLAGGAFGKYAITPLLRKVLPALSKSIMSGPVSGAGAKAAFQYGMAVAKGHDKMLKGAEAIFHGGKIESLKLDSKAQDKLEKKLDALRVDPTPLLNNNSQVGHYLPDHAMNISSTLANSVNYLNSLKPTEDRQAPLDPLPKPNSTQLASYKNALQIASDPTIVLKRIKDGMLTQQDIQHLNAISPDLYKMMQGMVMQQMIEAKEKGVNIPYHTKLSLSAFVAQPLESSMMPNSIASNQMAMAMQMQQVQAKNGIGVKPTATGMQSLQKQSGLYSTTQQNRSLSRSSRR